MHAFDLHVKFQPLRVKTVATKERGIFVAQPTEQPIEWLVVPKINNGCLELNCDTLRGLYEHMCFMQAKMYK